MSQKKNEFYVSFRQRRSNPLTKHTNVGFCAVIKKKNHLSTFFASSQWILSGVHIPYQHNWVDFPGNRIDIANKPPRGSRDYYLCKKKSGRIIDRMEHKGELSEHSYIFKQILILLCGCEDNDLSLAPLSETKKNYEKNHCHS